MTRNPDLPTLRTDRLLLRAFQPTDATRVRNLAGDPSVAATTANIPHPYPHGAAEQWIATHVALWQERRHATFALCTRADGLIGCFSVMSELRQGRGELGYWIGRPYWNHGYCTEAGRAIVPFAFDVIGLRRLYACHIVANPASGRVMEKLHLRHEGVLRGHQLKDGLVHDLAYWGLLHDDLERSDPGRADATPAFG